jgi:hypothetical protein
MIDIDGRRQGVAEGRLDEQQIEQGVETVA